MHGRRASRSCTSLRYTVHVRVRTGTARVDGRRKPLMHDLSSPPCLPAAAPSLRRTPCRIPPARRESTYALGPVAEAQAHGSVRGLVAGDTSIDMISLGSEIDRLDTILHASKSSLHCAAVVRLHRHRVSCTYVRTSHVCALCAAKLL